MAGVRGATVPFVLWLAAAPLLAAAAAPGTARLRAGGMVVEFDTATGALRSITEAGGRYGTNYVGNPDNVPGTGAGDAAWTGHVVSTVWELRTPEPPLVLIPSFSFRPSGTWKREETGRSEDIRRTSFDGTAFRVEYAGRSANEGGLRSYDLRMLFRPEADGALLWELEIENTTGRPLEIGELSFPLMLNDAYYGVRTKDIYTNTADDREVLYEDERLKVREQAVVHEERVVGHLFAGGHGSYALVERLLGDPPYLLIHPVGDTAFECQYRYEDAGGTGGRWRPRPTVLAVHSRAVRDLRDWPTPWVNGHTSLVLPPGGKKRFAVRFVLVPGYDAVRREIAAAGNLGIRVLPSMVVPEDEPVLVEVSGRFDPSVEFLSDNCRLLDGGRVAGDRTLLVLAFRGRGQKTVRLSYDGGKWTALHFYCTEPTAKLIDARARFIVERQFLEDPGDPYGRNHMFLPFDHGTGSVFRDAEDVWEVGGSDEYGFSEPLFLAEKNVYRPDGREVRALEAYAVDFLMGRLQDPETFALRASVYWKDRTPSSPWGHWTESRSKESYRTYNYPHAANIYHALYRIGKLYGLTSARRPEEYLRFAYRTAMKWFETGPWRHVGLMGGSNALNILTDLEAEGWGPEAKALRDRIRACNDTFNSTPYPYSSELFVDQTAHEQVGMFTWALGSRDKFLKTLQVIQALRGGDQPLWFRFGNNNRRDMACWYTDSLASLPLLKGYEASGDAALLVRGYAGLMSVTANLLPDGMGFGQFISSPGVFAHDPPRTLDGGIGMYGYLKGIKAYVFEDEAFGTVGASCRVEKGPDSVRAVPTDGLRKRLRFSKSRIDVEAVKGEIVSIELFGAGRALDAVLEDPTGLVDTAEIVVRGLDPGRYVVEPGGAERVVASGGDLRLTVPMAEARRIRVRRAS